MKTITKFIIAILLAVLFSSGPISSYAAYSYDNDFIEDGGSLDDFMWSVKVPIHCLDQDTKKEISGIKIMVYDSKNKNIFTGTTSSNGLMTSFLDAGNYTMKQVYVPSDYKLNSSTAKFTIKSNGNISGTTTLYNRKFLNYKVTIKYVEKSANKVLKTDSYTYKEGSSYNFSSTYQKTFQGYEYQSVSGSLKGTVNKDTTIYVYYKKIPVANKVPETPKKDTDKKTEQKTDDKKTDNKKQDDKKKDDKKQDGKQNDNKKPQSNKIDKLPVKNENTKKEEQKVNNKPEQKVEQEIETTKEPVQPTEKNPAIIEEEISEEPIEEIEDPVVIEEETSEKIEEDVDASEQEEKQEEKKSNNKITKQKIISAIVSIIIIAIFIAIVVIGYMIYKRNRY